ncbi:MAG: hypothetical protein ACFB8W_07065 [Elainellaceae cyanobacterium]
MNRLQEKVSGEWSVQVYDGDRRLVCSLYPSHCWSAAAGFCLGILLTASAIGCSRQTAPSVPSSETGAPAETPLVAPLWLD